MTSVSITRAEHESRLNDERRRQERGKSLVVLMLHHFLQSGYAASVEALQAEYKGDKPGDDWTMLWFNRWAHLLRPPGTRARAQQR